MSDTPSHPKISVSIVTWNSCGYIDNCLKAVFAQERINCEIVVVDNGSNDGTLDYLEEQGNLITLIRIPFNSGFSHAHNTAIEATSNPYIVCLNPDVFLEHTYLSQLVRFLESNPEYGGAIGKILQCKNPGRDRWENYQTNRVDTMGLEIERSRHFVARRFELVDDDGEIAPMEVFGVDGMAPVYRRTMLEETSIKAEFFDEQFFAYCEDQDLSWRARLLGWRFACVPTSIAYHVRTWRPSNISARKTISPLQKRNALRNHYWMVIKNDCISLALLHSPFILYRFILVVGFSVLFERNTLLAFIDIICGLPTILRKRREIMNRKTISRRQMLSWYRNFEGNALHI